VAFVTLTVREVVWKANTDRKRQEQEGKTQTEEKNNK
jgi:hypothetical protein